MSGEPKKKMIDSQYWLCGKCETPIITHRNLKMKQRDRKVKYIRCLKCKKRNKIPTLSALIKMDKD